MPPAFGLALILAAGPPAELIDRLGSPGFADRERAAQELTGYAADALPALGAAARSHPSAEVRRRADALAVRLRRWADAAGRVAVPPVELTLVQLPLAAAVAEVRGRTGVPLQLGGGVADPHRPVTLRTGKVPPWEAVAAFCRAADLHEVVKAEVATGATADPPVRRFPRFPDPTWQVPVVLADGAGPLPADRSCGVRVQVPPADFPGHRATVGGLVQLALEVTPLPLLGHGGRWDELTAVRVLRAEDEFGQPVPAAHPDDPPADPVPGVAFGGLLPPALLNPPFGEVGRQTVRPNPRLATVSLRLGDRPARRLRALDGVAVGEVTLPDQPLIVLSDLRRVAGAGATGVGDTRLAVLAVTTDPVGRSAVRLRVEAPNPWTFPRAGRNAGLVPWLGPPLFGPSVGPLSGYRFADAAGRPLVPAAVRPGPEADDGLRRTAEVEFRFDPTVGAGPPARLVLLGDQPVTVEVPFRLRDVPLP